MKVQYHPFFFVIYLLPGKVASLMFKSVIIASLLFASQVFAADYHGGPCAEALCSKGRKACDSVNPTKLLYCGGNSIHCGYPFGSTYWYLDQTCGHCCILSEAEGPFCASSRDECIRLGAERYGPRSKRNTIDHV